QLVDQVAGSLSTSTSSNDIINNQDPLSSLDSANLHLEPILAILLLVGNFDALSRKLAGLADWDESGAQPQCEGGAKEEAAGLETNHNVDTGEGWGQGGRVGGENMDLHGADERLMERGRGEDGQDVFKEDAGRWKVWVLAERFAERPAERGVFLSGISGLCGV